MNMTVIIAVAVAVGAGTFYAKGRVDENRRKELARIVQMNKELEAKANLARQLSEMSARDAIAARKEFQAKKDEADGLREELAKKGKAPACQWTPSQRDRLRRITIGKAGTSTAVGQRGKGSLP